VVPGTDVPLLSWTTQMPGPSFSLPARQTCPGMTREEGSACIDCEVFERGRYKSERLKMQQQVRKRWVEECLKSSEGSEILVRTLTAAFDLTGHIFVRAHDAGDVFKASYARAWARICKNLPDVQFWFPTRSWEVSWILPALQDLAELPNLAVRPSAHMIAGPPPVVPGLSAGTLQYEDIGQVPAGVLICPATSQGNQCGRCTACWTLKNVPIAFEKR
jgi:hypothetical protein